MSENELRKRIEELVDAITNATTTEEVAQLGQELEKCLAELKELERQPALPIGR